MAPKPKIIPHTQTRLDGFFAQYRRQPGSPAKSSSSGKLNETPKSVVSNTAVALRESLPLSPKKKPIERIESSKRPWTDDESDDGIIPIPVRPRKSPRATPQPETKKPDPETSSVNHVRISSSSLSPLNSPTPASPQLQPSFEAVAQTKPYQSQPMAPERALDIKTPGDRPLTSDSNRSVPAGSFSSFRTATSSVSQRVVRNGQEMVLNSDSDPSDDSLDDLDDILGRPKVPVKSSSPLTDLSRTPTPPTGDLTSDLRQLPRNGASNSERRSRQEPSQPSTMVRFNLDALVARTLAQNQRNAPLQETLDAIDELDRSDGGVPQPTDNEGQLRSLLKGTGADDENAERLMEAMQRTEALVHERKWSFFDYDRFHARQHEVELDDLDCGNHPAAAFIYNEDQLQEVLVNGYFKHLTKVAPLSQGLVRWLFQHALYDSRADVRAACLQALSNDACVSKHDFYSCIQKELVGLGMRGEYRTWQQSPIVPDRPSVIALLGQEEGKQPVLGQLLRLISATSSSVPASTAAEVAVTVARMAVDNRITSDVNHLMLLSTALKNSLATLSQQEDEQQLQAVLQTIYKQATNDDFRLCMLDALSQSNVLTSSLRRRLALTWFYEDPTVLLSHSRPFTSDIIGRSTVLLDFSRVAEFIKSRDDIFRIGRRTDWTVLNFKLDLLTIGIGAGDPPTSMISSQNNGIPVSRMKELRDAIKAYNAQVDLLAQMIKRMHSLVVDRGTSHVSRTEAKDNLERLKTKLNHMVRTKAPPKKSIFEYTERDIGSYLEATPKVEQAKPAENITVVEETVKTKPALKGSFLKRLRAKGAQKNVDMAMNNATCFDDSTSVQSTIVSPSEYHDAIETPTDVTSRSETEQEDFHVAAESLPA